MADPGGLVEDDLLRLVLMCTHPALAPEAASALALRLVMGVSTHDIARLFLVTEPTAAARITRAKKKIVAAGIPFAVPAADVLPQRLETVAQAAYLAFTAGYAPGSGPDLLRADLAGEAIRLVRVVRRPPPGRAGADGPAGADAAAALSARRTGRRRRAPRAAPRPGPGPVAPRRDRRGPGTAGRPGPDRAGQPARRGVPPAGPHRRRARHRRPRRRRPAGTGSSSTTTCCCGWSPRRAPGWPGRSRSPRRPVPARDWPHWTASTSPAATASPPSGPSCWPGAATRRRPGPRTTSRSPRAATTPNGRTCSSGRRRSLASEPPEGSFSRFSEISGKQGVDPCRM